MKINRNSFINNKTYHLESDIDFTEEKFHTNLRKILSCHVDAELCDYEDILRVELHIKADVIVASSYSLKDVNLKLNFKDELDFSDKDEDAEECIIEKNSFIDLDPYILGLIISEIPTKVTANNETLPTDGVGYRVLTEDELNKEKSERKDPRWSKLDDIKL